MIIKMKKIANRLLNPLSMPLNYSSIIFFSSKKYILSQFPYPSGELHLGHARVYYIGDSLARYYKLHRLQVIYPIGFDSFGLPAENAAILHGKDPKLWTQNNILQMKSQLQTLNINFDWSKQFATHTPQYYRWTQQIFVKMFKKGLAYKGQSQVNWDPIDQTVLANEQVDNQGRSWRSGAVVQKKMLSQWFLKITQYAEQLQNNLQTLEWIERVKSMQAGWIGFQKGYKTELSIIQLNQNQILQTYPQLMKLLRQPKISVFLKDPYDLKRQSFIRYNIKDTQIKGKNQKQLFLGKAKTKGGQILPIFLGSQANGLEFQLVVKNEKNTQEISSIQVKDQSFSEQYELSESVAMRIRDWSISRQRYWGTPIPIIYCSKCGIVPVPQQDLPVLLPQWNGKGNPLLARDFKECKCPKCLGPAQRETDTMDTFVDSSWYFLRFLDNKNTQELCKKQLADNWMPVDIYIGGIQHAIMHLLYARFIMRALSDFKGFNIKQPFKELVVQGLVKGKTIKHKETGRYLRPSEVANYRPEEIEETYEKMSKSKFNGLNPQSLVQKFGSDSLRMALFFASPPQNDVDFHEDQLVAAERFLKKVEQTFRNLKKRAQVRISQQDLKISIFNFCSKYNENSYRIKQILLKLEISMQKRFMHVYVANLMELFNEIKFFIKNNKDSQDDFTFLFSHILTPSLSLVAPVFIKQIFSLTEDNLQKLLWPKSQYFIAMKEYTIMKGGKIVKKGYLEYNQQNMDDNRLRTILNLTTQTIIKHNKKSIVIITK